MPVRRKMAALADEIGEYLIALVRHWGPLVSGAAIGLISWAYGVKTKEGIPALYYLALVGTAGVIATFLAWREEYRARSAIRPRLVACETRSIVINATEISIDPAKPQDALVAATAAFQYDPALSAGPRVLVQAQLSFEQYGNKYQGGGQTTAVGSGYWRDTSRNRAIFGPGVQHELIVATDHRGLVSAIQDERADRSDKRPTILGLGCYPMVLGYGVKIKLIMLDETNLQRLAVDTFRYLLEIGENQFHLSPIDDE